MNSFVTRLNRIINPKISLTLVRTMSVANFKEIKIPMPWGNISAKWWGPMDKRPIVAVHGWQDNCGTFDLLIPTLPQHLSFLAIDLPGHGLSDKLPPGMYYHFLDNTILLRRLQLYFKWEKISLMGHSLGAITSYTFAFFYPDNVDFLICFDGLHPLLLQDRINADLKSLEGFLKYDAINSDKSEPPSYSYEEVINRFYLGISKSIDLDKCKYIADRNIKESSINPGKFYFNRDFRLKCLPVFNWGIDDILKSAARIKFPIMVTRSSYSPTIQGESFQEVIKIIEGNIDDLCELHQIDGKHHAHLNAPEVFKDITSNFIRKHDKEDRSMCTKIADLIIDNKL